MTLFDALHYLLLLCATLRWALRLLTPSSAPRVPLVLNVLAMGPRVEWTLPPPPRRARGTCSTYRHGALHRCLACNASRRAHELT